DHLAAQLAALEQTGEQRIAAELRLDGRTRIGAIALGLAPRKRDAEQQEVAVDRKRDAHVLAGECEVRGALVRRRGPARRARPVAPVRRTRAVVAEVLLRADEVADRRAPAVGTDDD